MPMPYKHAIAAYGTAIAIIPLHISYGSCKKIHYTIPNWQRHGRHFTKQVQILLRYRRYLTTLSLCLVTLFQQPKLILRYKIRIRILSNLLSPAISPAVFSIVRSIQWLKRE
jgi:hypothetical protein